VDPAELLTSARNVALPAAQRAWRPVLPAQLVEHGAVDAGPRELLERGPLGGVVTLDRRDQRLEAARDEILDVTAGRELADLLEHDVLHERRVGHHQAVADPRVAGGLVLAPEGERVVGGHPLARIGLLHKTAAPLRAEPTDTACIGSPPDSLHHRFGVIASLNSHPRGPVRETVVRAGLQSKPPRADLGCEGCGREAPGSPERFRTFHGGITVLIITRRAGERIMVGDDIVIEIMEIVGNSVRVGIRAPRAVPVYREEIYTAVREENRAAAEASPEERPRPTETAG
jgi:carbon storage regulator